MKKLIFAALATGLIAVPGISQNRPDPACRREIIQLCGVTRDRAAIRACLQDKFTSLSRDCLSKLAEALRQSGAKANAVGITNSSHMKLNKDLGVTGDSATALVDAFIKSAL